jgi:Flp pilus assembly protein TadG
MPRFSLHRLSRDEQGTVILETALMLTILLMLMFGIFDVGRVLYTANGLTSAAREGARTGAVTACGTAATTAQNTAIARFTPFGGAALTAAQVTVTVSSPCAGGSVRVAIAYPFSWITPLPRLMGWTNSGTFSSTINTAAEYKYEL